MEDVILSEWTYHESAFFLFITIIYHLIFGLYYIILRRCLYLIKGAFVWLFFYLFIKAKLSLLFRGSDLAYLFTLILNTLLTCFSGRFIWGITAVTWCVSALLLSAGFVISFLFELFVIIALGWLRRSFVRGILALILILIGKISQNVVFQLLLIFIAGLEISNA